MQQEFARHGIGPVQRFPACDGETLAKPAGWIHSAGAYGCLRSHVEVIREAQRSNAQSVLIFEDDTVLDPEFQSKFASFSKEVPDDWDMLYFGALHKDEPAQISEHVGRITKANSTYAYALKNTVFAAFIELNTRAENVIDMNSYILQERFNCYCFMPNLAWVEAEYSDVQNRLERHWYLEKSLVLFGAHMDRLLSRTTIAITGDQDSKNVDFLKRYYEEYFAPLAEIVIGDVSDFHRDFLILSEGDIYLEALDIRHVYIRPRTPHLNGKVERSHRVDDQEFYQLLDKDGITDDIHLFNAKLKEWEDSARRARSNNTGASSSRVRLRN